MGKTDIKKCDQCRTEGVKLFLKGDRCSLPTCPIQKKGAVVLGVGGKLKMRTKRRVSEYGTQLREKQKMRRLYGIDEKQFKNYFDKARKVREATGEALFQMLESRLDNVMFRLGFVPSRSTARQLISHGHVNVNNKKVDIPSYLVKPGETISLTTKGLKIPTVSQSLSDKDFAIPEWLEKKAAVGRMRRLPKREEIDTNVNEQVVVEYYSR